MEIINLVDLGIAFSKLKYTLFALIFLLVFSGCCKEEIVESSKLTERQKSLVPYKSNQILNFVDEEGITIIVESQLQEIITEIDREHPERCGLIEFEIMTTTLNFEIKDLKFFLTLSSRFFNSTLSITTSNNSDSLGFPRSTTRIGYPIPVNSRDVTIKGFDFQNVIVFRNSSTDSQIINVVYSPANGIEFIELKDGKWLKLSI